MVFVFLRKTNIHFFINSISIIALLYFQSSLLHEPQSLITITIAVAIYLTVVILSSGKISNKTSSYQKVNIDGDIIDNIFAGVYVGGAAGSGKTRAIITKIMRHFGQHKFGGLVYAYKNFELVEYGLPLYGKENCKIFAPNNPDITIKVNPLDPKYFKDESEIKEFYIEMAQNLNRKKSGGGNDTSIFFSTASIGLLTGVTIVLMKNYPKYCTLPHVSALCLTAEHSRLVEFLKTEPRAVMQAQTYITSTENQLAGIQGTVFNFLSSFATPSVFFSLYDEKDNYVSLKPNDKKNPFHLFLVNDITNEGVILPVINAITYLCMRLLPKGHEDKQTTPSYILIDEGSTLNLQGFSRKPATLRSFDIATIFSIQDLSLGIEASSEATIRAINANLSYQYYGRVNDDKTAEFYEKVSPFIDKKQYSQTHKTGFLGAMDGSETTSTRETKKYRASDFRSLGTGQFVSFINAKCKKKNYNYKSGIPKEKVEPIRNISNQEIQRNYDNIISWAQGFLN